MDFHFTATTVLKPYQQNALPGSGENDRPAGFPTLVQSFEGSCQILFCRCETGWILLTLLWLIVTGCSGLGQNQYQANIIIAPVDLNAQHASLLTMKGADPNWIGLLLAGSPDVIQRLRQLGKRVFYVTNNSTKHRREYKTKVDKLGFGGDLVRWPKRNIILSLQLREKKQGQIKHHLSDNWKQTKVKTFNIKTFNKLLNY